MSRNLYWIWLALRMGAGREGIAGLLTHFGTPQNIYDAGPHELSDYFGEKKSSLCESLMNKNLEEAYGIEDYCRKHRIDILRYSQKEYPTQLTNLKNPPIILYARGRIADMDSRVAVGVVGTRRLSEYGRQAAYKIGYELGVAGAVVVSGLALGIDSVAACGALDARGRTVAVLGSGLDHIYPPAHKKLAGEIASRGMILSEYPPLTPPSRGSFPMRNRIISGLCQSTLVVEAGAKSGALITAGDAILQGRDLYAVPGNIDSVGAEGTNALLKDGAAAITCAADILEEYKYIYATTLNFSALEKVGDRSKLRPGRLAAHGVAEMEGEEVSRSGSGKGRLSELLHRKGHLDGATVKAISGETEYPVYNDDKRLKTEKAPEAVSEPTSTGKIPEGLSPDLAAVLAAMPVGRGVGVDFICAQGHEPGVVMTSLTMLEVGGLIETLPGNLYMRK